jgi:holo-[acyl-carrier protein] synthase
MAGPNGDVDGGNAMSVAGIGVDVVAHQRFAARVQAGTLARFADRVCTRDELDAACFESVSAARQVELVAGRWAAKEAVCKSLGVGLGDIGLHDVEVLVDGGSPQVRLSGRALARAELLGVAVVLISISHRRDRAGTTGSTVAFAVAERSA